MLAYSLMPPPAGGPATHHCLILHGLGDSQAGWKPVAPMLGVAHLGFIFADAPRPYYEGFAWFDLNADLSFKDEQIRASRVALDELITALLARLGIPSERLFLLGFSQGALMVMDTALRAKRTYAGVIGISGFLAMLGEYPQAFGTSLPSQHLLMTHGRADALLPLAMVRAQVQGLNALGLSIGWREYDKAHSLDPVHELPELRAFISARMQAS
jgi:predicted esterase